MRKRLKIFFDLVQERIKKSAGSAQNIVQKRIKIFSKFGADTVQNWCRFVALFGAGSYLFGAATKVRERRNKVLIRILALFHYSSVKKIWLDCLT